MNGQMRHDLMARGYSRRGLLRAAALVGGGAALPFYNEAALAQMSYAGEPPPGAVLINANENPLGPCAEALAAMQAMLPKGGRYLFGEVIRLRQLFAEQEGLGLDSVEVYAGSSDPLHRAVLAFCSPERAFVTADPGYEAGERAASYVHAPVVKTPLNAKHEHDVKQMVARAGGRAGLFYVCNPNNPTGTVTPRAAIEWLVENKPAGSVVLLDEAYLHFCEEPSGADLVRAGKDVLVLRTFSKIYGMAGLRAGAAFGRPELLGRIRMYATGFLPSTGMVGAAASLRSPNVVAERKKITRETRESVFAWLRERKFEYVPSISNKFMLDAKRPGRELAKALAAEQVYVGRVWPAWPNHVRVTVGTPEEMARFQSALARVFRA
jgi:histidinol-phosphate aminotransferase